MKILIFLISLPILVACEKTYTVNDFMGNEEIRQDFLSRCKNGEIHPEHINCINVKKANMRILMNADKRSKNIWN